MSATETTTATATGTLPIETPTRHNWRTGSHSTDYKAVPGLGWMAVWSEQDGPGPRWYRLMDRGGAERAASRAEFEAYTYRGVRYRTCHAAESYMREHQPGWLAVADLPDAEAHTVLARIVAGTFPREDCRLAFRADTDDLRVQAVFIRREALA